jgi:phosphoribosylaminoimidazole-succinocarboxamide synthase
MPVKETHFQLPGQTAFYRGKVRDVYSVGDDLLVMIASDRISAFDVVLPEAIPFKGQVLNQIASMFLEATKDIVPNWVIAVPDPNVTIGKRCEPFKVEMVIRGYLAGHAWRTYRSGGRTLCGVTMPDGLRENEAFPEPIITPTTKASEGHDEDISRADILKQGIVNEADYLQLEDYARKLYARGQEMAAASGLILVDTKYEFGKIGDTIYLIDEIHTPDSSRYFYLDGYQERLEKDEAQKQLSKEFVREWLIANDFMGKEGQTVPTMSEEWVRTISDRYIELFEKITGNSFQKADQHNIEMRILHHITDALNAL